MLRKMASEQGMLNHEAARVLPLQGYGMTVPDEISKAMRK